MAHALNWFEIPVLDFPRAKRFYEQVLDLTIETMVMEPYTMGMLSNDPDVVGGALVMGEGCVPATDGTLVYLSGGEDLAVALARVVPAGGTVLVPKTDIGNGFGFFAHFMDTEGNKVGLHSMA